MRFWYKHKFWRYPELVYAVFKYARISVHLCIWVKMTATWKNVLIPYYNFHFKPSFKLLLTSKGFEMSRGAIPDFLFLLPMHCRENIVFGSNFQKWILMNLHILRSYKPPKHIFIDLFVLVCICYQHNSNSSSL